MIQPHKLVATLAVASLPFAGIASAQTTSYPSTGTTNTSGTSVTNTASGTGTTGSTSGTGTTGASGTSGTPGVPNTGAGGDMAQNLALLAASGVIVLAGGAYLARRATAASAR